MLLNCGVGEDSWESLGLIGDQTSQSWRKSTLNILWKDWCWIWSSNTLATWCEQLTPWKRPWCWEILKTKEKGATEDGWIGSITGSMNMNLRRLQQIEKNRGAWVTETQVTKSWTRLGEWTATTTILQDWRQGRSFMFTPWLCIGDFFFKVE